MIVEVPMTQKLPGQISFMNEHGELANDGITYEWRPTVFEKYNKVGHLASDCRHGKAEKVGVQNQPNTEQEQTVKVVLVVDQE